jgi:hypothetical protein
VTTILDAGALIGLDRNDRSMWVRLKGLLNAGEVPVTHGGVVGQVWRGGPRQARLAVAMRGMDVRPLDEQLGRLAGELLAATRQSDAVDAALAVMAVDGDDIITLDIDDLQRLVRAAGRHVELIRP